MATAFSVLNKICDVAPELLIGAAVDVVVNRGRQSLVGRVFGVDDRFDQLTILAAVTVVVWILESITDYIADVTWRTLAQTIEHDTRMEAYRHVQELELAYFEDHSSGGLMAVLNDDVNQLERFLDVGRQRAHPHRRQRRPRGHHVLRDLPHPRPCSPSCRSP